MDTLELETEGGAFTYDKLGNSTPSIRLVTIQPAESLFDLVECRLETASLDAPPPYVVHQPVDQEDAELDHAVLCNDTLLPVSEHTYFFLCTLRTRSHQSGLNPSVWTPRVCVNLQDKDETVRQQSLLAAVFQRATQRVSVAPSYIHQPLKTFDSIRVLELAPPGHHKNGLLMTRMRDVPLASNPVYYYLDIREGLTTDAWPDKVALICNNRLLNVPRPLHQVLAMVLSAKGPRAFFVPAVSVNKHSAVDVKHHAAITDGLIRKQAKEVVGIMQPRYQYIPLLVDRPHIRLMKLLPAKSDQDTIVVDVCHFPLEECPPFVALSYTRTSAPPQWMVCTRDGRYIACTANLRLALIDLRRRGHLVVWADGICINQQDTEEKSKQLLLRGDIFGRAAKVIVELGIDCPKRKHRSCREHPAILVKMLASTGRLLEAVRPDRPELDNREFARFGIPPATHQAWSGWRAMRSQEWFTQCWMVHEVVAGRNNVSVLYNEQLHRWADVAAANSVTADGEKGTGTHIGRTNMTNLREVQKGGNDRQQPRLLHLLEAFRSLSATDPRDKIYAFRGLAVDRDQSPLPDYAKSVEDIYLEYARFFVQQGLGLGLLSDAGTSRSGREKLPSWVPDWSFNAAWQTFSFCRDASQVSLGALQKEEAGLGTTFRLARGNARALVVPGHVVDDIAELSPAVPDAFLKEKSASAMDQAIRDLYERAQTMAMACMQQLKPGADADATLSQLQTMLIGGAGNYGFEPLAEFYAMSRILASQQQEQRQDEPQHQEEPEQEEQEQVQRQQQQQPVGVPAAENGTASTEAFDDRLRRVLSRRRFCRTRGNGFGLVPAEAETGDAIVWVRGARAAMVMRREKDGDGFMSYRLVGDGFMSGPSFQNNRYESVSPASQLILV